MFLTHLYWILLHLFLWSSGSEQLELTSGHCGFGLLHCLVVLDKYNHGYNNQLRTKWPSERLTLLLWLDWDVKFPVSHLGSPLTWRRRFYRKAYRKHLTTGLMPDFTHVVKEDRKLESLLHLNQADFWLKSRASQCCFSHQILTNTKEKTPSKSCWSKQTVL